MGEEDCGPWRGDARCSILPDRHIILSAVVETTKGRQNPQISTSIYAEPIKSYVGCC